MKKSKFPSIPDSRWIYFVYYYGAPIGVFTNVTLAAALYKKFFTEMGEPPEGVLYVYRYRPAVDYYRFKEENITGSIQKIVCNG